MKWKCYIIFINVFLWNDISGLQNCVNKILENYYQPGIIIFLVDSPQLQITFPTVRQNSTQFLKKFVYQLPEIVVITSTNIEKHLIFLEKIGMLNPRAKFLILAETHFGEIFAKLAEYFIYSAIILNQDRKIISYEPFLQENIKPEGEPIILGNCTNSPPENIFQKKFPKLWRNTTVRALFTEHFPYLYYDEGILQGENYKVLNVVKEKLQFNIVFKELDERKSWRFLGLSNSMSQNNFFF